MSTPADQINPSSPTPSQGDGGSDLRSVANQIEGLLDDDGHFNPNPDQLSRGHPDYDESSDERAQTPDRDERGRFTSSEATEENDDLDQATDEIEGAGDDLNEDTRDAEDTDTGDTDEDQTTSAVDDESATEDAETGDIETLAQLAEALELSSVDELKGALTHTFMAAGEEVTVTLQELEAGYQKDADYRRQTGQLADARRAAEQEYMGRMQQYDQANVVTAQTLNAAEQLLAAELQSPALEQLRERDPAEWTARREEIGQRLGQLRQAMANAAQQYGQFRQTQQSELKQREQQMLTEKMPDFGSNHIQIARGAMESLGYVQDEISQIFDHRLVLGALELASLRHEVETLRAEKAAATDATKRVKKDVPKLQKPGKRNVKSKARVRRDNVQRLKNRAAKSGSVGDAAAVIETMI